MQQSPAHAGGASGGAGASFLVLIEEDGREPHSGGGSGGDSVPEFDWVQIRETRGALRLYRHAALGPYGGTSGGRRRRGPPPQPSPPPRKAAARLFQAAGGEPQPQQPQQPQPQPQERADAAVAAVDCSGCGSAATTSFRPARLSTVLLLDCRVPPPPSTNGGDGDGDGNGRNGGCLPSAKVTTNTPRCGLPF